MSQINYVETAEFYVERDVMKAPLHEMHYHNGVEVYYLIKGERDYFIGDDFYKLTEGDAVIIPGGVLHRTAGRGASRYLVYFDPDILRGFFSERMLECIEMGKTIVFHPDETRRESFLAAFNTLFSEYGRLDDKGTAAEQPLIGGHLFEILFTMSCGNNTYVNRDCSDGRVGEIIKYVNENYGSIRSIDEIAERFFVSKYHLCRVFNKSLGVPLMTYLNTIKVKNAASMIGAGRMKLTDVATACGFNSSSYFSKVFRAEMGISPTEYRKKLKAEKQGNDGARSK